jgi:hypothetical protein
MALQNRWASKTADVALLRPSFALMAAKNSGSCARRRAKASYSANEPVTSSANPIPWSKLPAIRETNVSPEIVTNGSPLQSASLAVVQPLNGTVSKNKSAS